MRSAIESAASDVSDATVDGSPNIRMLLASLELANNAHAVAVRAVMESDRQIAEFRALATSYKQQISELEQAQANVAVDCVLGDDDAQATWLDTDKAIEVARRCLRQHELAIPLLEAQAKESPPQVASLASEVTELESDLARARWAAKLEIARDQKAQ